MTTGIRWYRRDDMDDLPAPGEGFRSDLLRELVDQLPAKQRHVIERTFFGGASLLQAAAEAGVSPKHARDLRAAGIARLRALLDDHQVG
jgi:DNA-directed RNA polymerase specialized sigma24 family protein